MKLTYHNEIYECASATKNKDSIILYDENGIKFAEFRKVKDISAFSVEDGNWGVKENEPTPEEDTAAMLVDHEYRLTILELGLVE